MTTQVKTDLSLKGVSVTEIWTDEVTGSYFSLIRIPREEYTAILERNNKRRACHAADKAGTGKGKGGS